jgi:hypothetical protein
VTLWKALELADIAPVLPGWGSLFAPVATGLGGRR